MEPNPHDQVTPAPSRRSFLKTAVTATAAVAVLKFADAQAQTPRDNAQSRASSFLDLLRNPDEITTYARFEKTVPAGALNLRRAGERWTSAQVTIEGKVRQDALVLTLSSPAAPLALVHVRWRAAVAPGLRALGDAWERSYGDLGWRHLIPERVMPWYFATHDGMACHGYGVRTDARALCFWQLDSEGVSLWLNITNGGNPVELGDRQLALATIVSHRGEHDQDAHDSIAGLCRAMCARTSRFAGPVYGANDWYSSYGSSTAESILRDTEFIVELSPQGGVRPFSVIDGGWANGTTAWPDMGKLAASIRQRTARPGIWIRPLEAPSGTAPNLLLPPARFGKQQGRASALAFDPTIPEARELVAAKIRELAAWGYDMVKHDFSTFDLLGRWGFEMGPQPTLPGWSFHDRSLTNAEVLANLYTTIREAAGEHVLLDGCNTVGHLGQGIFDMQRTGDDTSGHQWERTRRMGVNTLAFRLPQHQTFFTQDADCVGITDAIPWEFNRQWLDVLARSGTATLVSAGPPARGPQQRAALRSAFELAATGGSAARPLDWMDTSAPERWGRAPTEQQRYQWSGSSGASPFLGP